MTVYKKLLAHLLPSRCPGCGIPTGSAFCSGCRHDFGLVQNPCSRCGLDRHAAVCPRAQGPWRISGVIAPFLYTEPLQGHVQALKFGGRRGLGRALGELLTAHVEDSQTWQGVDALIAVPLHRQRFLARGYNQALEIARPVSAALRIPLLVAGVSRVRSTQAQTQLIAAQRRANLRGAFRVSRTVTGMHLAIVDDVMTTGATINALALELARAGAASVRAWAVARSL